MKKKRGQISVEYLIVIGFVVFIVIALLAVALYYVSSIRDNIRLNQVEGFANKIISNSETVFFAGEPSKITITAFLPAGIEELYINGNNLVFKVSSDTGTTVIAYGSDVPITILGAITINEGLKKLEIEAFDNEVVIKQV